MRPAPAIGEAPKYPVTAGLGLLAIVVTVLVMNKSSGDGRADLYPLFTMDLRAFKPPPDGQPWRLLSATLPHVGWTHLAFNVIWLWALGAQLEERFGVLRYVGLIVLLAVASSAAEYALFAGGVGLSGVGYGLWGFRYALSKREPRSIDLMDERTSVMFVIWFFVCIATTYLGLMSVANVAHGVGAVMGLLLGYATARAPRWTTKHRAIAGVGAGLLLLTSCLLATIFRPVVNHRPYAGTDAADVAMELLRRSPSRVEDARGYLRRCLDYTPKQSYCAYKLELIAPFKDGDVIPQTLLD